MDPLSDRLRATMALGGMDLAAVLALYGRIFTLTILATMGKAQPLRIVPTGAFASRPSALLPQRPAARVCCGTPWLILRYAMAMQPSFAMQAEKAPV